MQSNGPLQAVPPEQGLARDDLPRVLDVEVDPPVEWGNQTYASLHLEEPTARMVLRAEGELGPTPGIAQLRAYQIALVSNAANVPRGVIENMRISQVLECYAFLLPFIGGGPATGAI
jgi:hypothetical protein